MDLALSEADVARFHRDGFLIRERIVGPEVVAALREAMARTFDGEYPSGLMPDEVNWRPGHDPHVTAHPRCHVAQGVAAAGHRDLVAGV